MGIRSKSKIKFILSFFAAFTILITACGAVFAQGPPPLPADYSGYVTINGELAPDGTLVFAKVEDYTSYSCTVADEGRYQHLLVAPPDSTYIEKTIEFYVDVDAGGPQPAALAEETDVFEEGTSTELNLSVQAPEFVVSNLVIYPEKVGPGEALTITADVANTGGVRFILTLTLRINGAVEATEEVALAGGDSTTVSFTVTKDVPGTYSVDMNGLSGSFKVLKPAEFVVSNLAISPAEVEGGETVSISVDVKNLGDLEGAYTLTLLIDGAVEDARDVPLAGGGTASVTFGITKNIAGTYGVEVDGLTGSFKVTEPTTPPTTPSEEFAEFTVTSLTITPSEVLVGNQVAINVDVKNVGNVEGTYTLALRINEVLAQTRDVTLAGGASGTVTFIVIENAEGTYNVAVDELTGSFTVVAPPLLPAAFTVSSLTISPSEVVVGEEVTISVTVKNTGDLEGTYTVTLKINGIIENIENVTLAGGMTKSVTFRVAEGTEGTYNVEVDGLTGTFVVTEPAPSPGPTPPPTTEPLIGLWMTGGIIAAAVIISVAVFYVRRER